MENGMFKTLLAAAAAITLLSGSGFAQSSMSTSTTESTTMAPPATRDVDIQSTTRRTSDSSGVTIEKDKSVTSSGPAIVPDVSTTHSKTEMTTIR
jgi:hypothetical protein